MSGFLREGSPEPIVQSDYDNIKSPIIPFSFNTDCVIPVTINKFSSYALIDTGSSCNCISLTTLKKANMEEQEMSSKDKMQFKSASNSNMHTMGTVQIKIQIQGQQFQDVFYVFPTLSQDIILGRPFLHKFQAKIDLQEETMTLDRSFDVCAISYHTLKPGESILIAGEVRQCTLPSGLNALLTQGNSMVTLISFSV